MSVAALAGVGAGIFGALFPLVVADLTRGTGHFNIGQGAIATAAAGLIGFMAMMPETLRHAQDEGGGRGD